MAINDTYFFQAHGTLDGQVYIHTLHFRESVAAIGTDAAQQLINLWQSTCQTPWLAAHTSAYQLVRLTAQRICGSLPLPSATEEGVGSAGVRESADAGPLLAPWLCGMAAESTGIAGKSYRGRFFMSGLGENDVTGDALVAGGVSWRVKAQAYLTALEGEFMGTPPLDWTLVVHSRTLAAATPPPSCTVSSSPVIGLSLSSRLTSQRSRRA